MFQIIKNHIRLYSAVAIGFLVAWVVAFLGVDSYLTRSIVGYDTGVAIYILSAVVLMLTSTKTQMMKRSMDHDSGKVMVLFLVVIALIFSTCAIFADLALVKHLSGSEKYARLTLSFLTIILSWFFTNIVFALHYAHDYYVDVQKDKPGGLIFLPENEAPIYLDFLYFSFILGATAQTADVTLASKKMRRTCLVHSILAFMFNTTLLALTVNMASGVL